MIGPSSSSSLVLRWASIMLRERVSVAAAAATTSLVDFTASASSPSPLFHGFLAGPRHQSQQNSQQQQQWVPLLSAPCGEPQQQQQQSSSPHIWFAVPKSKISHSRKRMKNTRQKRIPVKNNIVFDPRTGEVTLKHKMPFNWKDYLPKVE